MLNILLNKARSIYGDVLYYKYKQRMANLISRGLEIGNNVTIERTVRIDPNYPYLIKIGNNCSLANGVFLLAHDATPYKFTGGHTRLGKIEIRDNVFIGTNSIILPGVTIGPNVLISAGSVVNKDIPPNSCVSGIPARFYKKFDDYLDEINEAIKSRPVFQFNELRGDRANLNKQEINKKVWNSVQNGIAFIKGMEDEENYLLNKVRKT